MIKIGSLNLSHLSGLSFSREKLRLTMTLAGIRDVAAGQIVSILSQRLRSELPTKLEVFLSDNMAQLILKPENITREYGIISIPEGVSRGAIKAMKNAMAQLTHDELLHDLEHQVAERTKELNFEKDRSEKLLQNMLPKSIAKRMKEGETIADNHEATVLFADIKGFTNMARYRSAQEVVEILDRIFSQFDTLADRHSLEKIKTIGDCYMAVAGVPTPLFDHVDRAVLMALDIVDKMTETKKELNINVDVRIGIHTGPLVAGVIGTKKYAYDIWGDTVNVASRMESHGQPNKVHISADVREKLGDRFSLTKRGTIEIKNRGTIETWFVNGISSIGTSFNATKTGN